MDLTRKRLERGYSPRPTKPTASATKEYGRVYSPHFTYRDTIREVSHRILEIQQIQALAEFRAILRGFLHFSEEAAVRVGVQAQHHQLMLQIAGAALGEVVTVAYLAKRLRLRHHSAVELCKRCEEAGWVQRERLPENRRWVVLRLTDAGLELLKKLSADHSKELSQLAPALICSLKQLAGSAPSIGPTAPEKED